MINSCRNGLGAVVGICDLKINFHPYRTDKIQRWLTKDGSQYDQARAYLKSGQLNADMPGDKMTEVHKAFRESLPDPGERRVVEGRTLIQKRA